MRITQRIPMPGYETLAYCEDDKSGLRALISLHSTKHGPAAGGCRFYDYPNLEAAEIDVQRLSRGMTYKNRAACLPLGGGKSVIIGSEKTPDIMRAFGEFVDTFGGAYYAAEDVGVSPDDMTHVAETTSYVAGLDGGDYASGDPSPVTAKGVFLCLQKAMTLALNEDDLRGKIIALQGLGHVGWYLAKHLHEAGAKLKVSDLSADVLARAERELDAEIIDLDKIFDVEADIFAPCAMGAVINNDTINKLNVKVIAGAANNQLSDIEAGDKLHARGIFYAPDYVINGGGIINVAREILRIDDEDYVENGLKRLSDNLQEIYQLAQQEELAMHRAADKFVEAQLG